MISRLSKSYPPPLGSSCKKSPYYTREAAEDMIRHIKETRVTKEIRVYKCEICGQWHLTSSRE